MLSASVLRVARASTNAPSSAQIIAITSPRAEVPSSPVAVKRGRAAAIQLSNTSAHASRTTVCDRGHDHFDGPDGGRMYENRFVIWGRMSWGRLRESA